jgi:anti-sigma factor RsiW
MLGKRQNGRAEHDRISQLLSAYLDGQVNDDQRAAIDRHLATCDDCRRELNELRWTVELLHELPAVQVPRSFAVPVTEPAPARGIWAWLTGDRGFLFLRGASALATVLLVFVVSLQLLGTTPFRGGASLPAPRAAGPQVEKPVEMPKAPAVVATPGGEAADQTRTLSGAPSQPPGPQPTAPAQPAAAAAAAKPVQPAQPAEGTTLATGQAARESVGARPTPEAQKQVAPPTEAPGGAVAAQAAPFGQTPTPEVTVPPPTVAASPGPEKLESRPAPTAGLPGPSPLRAAELLLTVLAAGLVVLTLVAWRERVRRRPGES